MGIGAITFTMEALAETKIAHEDYFNVNSLSNVFLSLSLSQACNMHSKASAFSFLSFVYTSFRSCEIGAER